MSELVAGKTVRQRVELCGKLVELRKKISMAPHDHRAKAKVMITRRMHAVRRILLGGGSPNLSDEILAPGVAAVRLLEELNALKNSPQAKRVAFAYRAKGIMGTMRALEEAERFGGPKTYDPAVSMDEMDAKTRLDEQLNSILSGNVLDADPLVDESVIRGKFDGSLRGELSDAKDASSKVWVQLSAIEAMMVEKYNEAEAELKRLSAAMLEAWGTPAFDAAYTAHNTYRDEVFIKVSDAKAKKLKIEQDQERSAFANVGRKLIAAVIDQSPITPDDASKWAAAQEITRQALARLKTLGYLIADVRADMAEFYRFTGGRVTAVRIHSSGDKRANATDIAAHGKPGTINLGSAFNKRVLWHELAHHMEADPVAKASAGQYVRRRSDGKVRSLRAITGNTGYRPDENALVGNFFEPYVGKIYNDGSTEVFSMGVESFSDPVLLAKRAMTDPQTLEFVSGFLRAPIDPMERTHMDLRTALQEITRDADGVDDDYVKEKIAELAGRVKFEPSTDMGWAVARQIEYHTRGYTMVGNLTQPNTGTVFHVMSGMVRQWATRRKVSGFLLVQKDDDAIGRTSGATVATKDKITMMAIMAIHQAVGYFLQPKDFQDAAYLRRIAP